MYSILVSNIISCPAVTWRTCGRGQLEQLANEALPMGGNNIIWSQTEKDKRFINAASQRRLEASN